MVYHRSMIDRLTTTLLAASLVAGCAGTSVAPQRTTYSSTIPRPAKVLVYDLEFSTKQIRENQAAAQRAIRDADASAVDARLRKIGQGVVTAYAETLVAGIREAGFDAIRANAATPVGHGDLKVEGVILRIDEGDRTRRVVVGLGAGESFVDAKVVVHSAVDPPKRLLDFVTKADSGKMPGAGLSLGAGAAAQGGVTAAGAAVSATQGGVRVMRSQVEQMAERSAKQAVEYMQKYFVVQGWITGN